MPAPDFDSDDLLRFVRETPLTFGNWRDFKSLYKRLEAEPGTSPSVLATLISRLDGVSLVADRDIPTADMGLSYNTGMPESTAVRGSLMAVLALGWQTSGLYIYDFSTPDALKPKNLGKLTWKGRGDCQEVIFVGNDLLCVRISDSQIKLYSIAGGGKPTQRGALMGRSGGTPTEQAARSGGIGFLAAAEQMIKGAFGAVTSASPDTSVDFANVSSISADGQYVYAACGPAGTKKTDSHGGLCIIDVSDPDNPHLAATVAIEDAAKVVLVPGRSLAVVLTNPRTRGRQNQETVYLIDISDPRQPLTISTLKVANGSSLIATETHLYVATANASYRGEADAGRVVDITTPQAPRLAGIIPLAGYYGIDHMAYRDGYLYASLRYGRLNIIDVRNPDKLIKVRELSPAYVKSLNIVEDRLYSGIAHSVALWNLQTPEHPTLIGMPPSAATLGYMKRRARRLLKNLAKSDSAMFTTIAASMLSASEKNADIDWATNWVLIDLLFGESGRLDQVSHGRGRMLETRPIGLRIRRREERGRAAWNAHPERATAVFTSEGAIWQSREMVLKVLRATGTAIPALPESLLLKCLAAPSVLLIAEAVRQTLARAQSSAGLKPGLAAEAFLKASPRQRKLLLASIKIHAGENAEWASRFADTVLLGLPIITAEGALPAKRTVEVAMAVFENFPAINCVLRLSPTLMASGQPLLRERAVRAAQRVSPAEAFAFLPQLLLVSEPEDQDTLLNALQEAVRGQAVPADLEDTILQTLLDTSAAQSVGWGWRVFAALAPTSDFLRSLWTSLLTDTTLEKPLQVAMASPDALTLLGRSGITNEEMSVYLQERPVLISLLSAQSFAVLTQSMPASVTLRMIAAATDDAWTRLREGWLRNLREGIGVNALWTNAEDALKADETGNLERRLIDDPEIAATITDADDVAGILEIREPSMAPLLGVYANRHIDTIASSDALLLTAATHPLPEVRDPGLAALGKLTIRLPMALGLMESEVPASIEAGSHWFEQTLEPNRLTRALALCDSPVASVRALGRDFVTAHRDQLPLAELSEALVEHADPKMQAFVARLLGKEPAPQFDREVLRVRNKAREAKEMVKTRQETIAATDGDGAVDTATLLALARGASIPRDSDWALTQLVRRAMAGETIEGLTIEGAAVAAPNEG